MGATQSAEEIAAALPEGQSLDGALELLGSGPTAHTLLFKFVAAGDGGTWTLASQNAVIKWYDANDESSKKTAWYLEIEAGDVDLLVSDSAELQSDLASQTATFFDAEHSTVCKLRFPTRDAAAAFTDTYHNRLYENLAGTGGVEVGKQGDWFFKPAETEAMDWEEAPEVAEAAPSTPRKWQDKEELAGGPAGSTVHSIAMGAGDNSFLVQDSTITVLRNDYGAVHQTGRGFTLTPPRGATGRGIGEDAPSFTPSKVMLMKGESTMNMLTPAARDRVHQADLETGSVVRTWACKLNGVDIPMMDITNDTSDAQLDNRSTFMGLDANRLCRWDQRTAEGVVQDLTYKTGKDYARSTNFTCMATSGEGYVAVGSQDGRVRLYGSRKGMESYEFKQAVTSIPGLGMPITSIDVSYDSRYIVATTDKFLMIIQTFFKDAKGSDTNGFVSKMASKCPAPRLLKLSPEDRMRMGKGAKFSKGKLTWITESNMTERWIAAGCGNYTVLWNFRRVKQHKPTVISSGAFTITEHYNLLKKDEKVVQNAFLHDKYAVTPQAKNALVVATEHKLFNCHDDESSDFEG